MIPCAHAKKALEGLKNKDVQIFPLKSHPQFSFTSGRLSGCHVFLRKDDWRDGIGYLCRELEVWRSIINTSQWPVERSIVVAIERRRWWWRRWYASCRSEEPLLLLASFHARKNTEQTITPRGPSTDCPRTSELALLLAGTFSDLPVVDGLSVLGAGLLAVLVDWVDLLLIITESTLVSW